MKPRYAIVRVDEGCPIGNDYFKNKTVENICKASKNCSNCALGDTKEQLINKVLTAIEETITMYEKGMFLNDANKNKSLAKFIVEFLGVEE